MKDSICRINESVSNTVNCSKFIYETTDVQSAPIKADSHVIGIIIKGCAEFVLGENVQSLGEGDVYVIKKGCTFSIRPEKDTEYSYIAFNGFRADELVDRIGATERKTVWKSRGEIIGFWLDCLYKSTDGNLDLFSEAALLYTVAHLSEGEKEKNDISEKITKYVNENFDDTNLGMQDIAKALGYDSKYLSALFKAKKGVTFTEYLRSVRIKHAAFLFEQGIESVKSVAILSGFSDALYFSKIFKKETGISPTDYMKKFSRTE